MPMTKNSIAAPEPFPEPNRELHKLFQLLTIILITQLVGVLGSLLSGNTGEIYTSFIKPPLSPPGWIFGVIWPVLYLLMSIAAYIIYQTPQTLRP